MRPGKKTISFSQRMTGWPLSMINFDPFDFGDKTAQPGSLTFIR
jgi:hypothetical protein